MIQLLTLTLIPTVIDLKNTSYLLYIKIQDYPEPYIKRKCQTVEIKLIYVLWLFQQLVFIPKIPLFWRRAQATPLEVLPISDLPRIASPKRSGPCVLAILL